MLYFFYTGIPYNKGDFTYMYFYREYNTKQNFKNLEKLFGLQAQLDMSNIPKSMEEAVFEGKDYFLEKASIKAKYSIFDISELKKDAIILSQNNVPTVLKSALLPSILKECNSAMLYVLTVDGFNEIQAECEDDILLEFITDAWGTAYTEAADNLFKEEIRTEFEKQGIFMTISHNPGQHLFPLTNQKVFFELLKPYDLNLTLTDSCLMQPSKSVSGIIGLSDKPQDLSKVSCDYCNMKNTCPSAYVC